MQTDELAAAFIAGALAMLYTVRTGMRWLRRERERLQRDTDSEPPTQRTGTIRPPPPRQP